MAPQSILLAMFKKRLEKFLITLSPGARKGVGIALALSDTLSSLQAPIDTSVERRKYGDQATKFSFLARLLLIRVGMKLKGVPIANDEFAEALAKDPLTAAGLEFIALKQNISTDEVLQDVVKTLRTAGQKYVDTRSESEAAVLNPDDAGDLIESLGYYGDIFPLLFSSYDGSSSSDSQDEILRLCLAQQDGDEEHPRKDDSAPSLEQF